MRKPSATSEQSGRFAYEGLDRVIHERARLSVLTSLAAHPKGLAFGDLKRLCRLTDGNLSRHLRILEYLAVLETVVADAATAARDEAPARRGLVKGFAPA